MSENQSSAGLGLVTTSTKLKYAMGGAAEGSIAWAFNGFNFIIYTIGFGLPGTLAGVAVFLSIVLDAVSDPLIGYVSDRWHSKLGRRHPFIYFASLPLAASIFCIYVPPDVLLATGGDAWSFIGYEATPVQWALAGWLFVFASLLKFFLTCYHLPPLDSDQVDKHIRPLELPGGPPVTIGMWLFRRPVKLYIGCDSTNAWKPEPDEDSGIACTAGAGVSTLGLAPLASHP